MNNLMQNDGRLSATFETKVAGMARSLIDQYATKFVKDSNKEQDDSNGSKQEPLLKERRKNGPQIRCETTTDPENDAEAARARRKAKLSAAMKGELYLDIFNPSS